MEYDGDRWRGSLGDLAGLVEGSAVREGVGEARDASPIVGGGEGAFCGCGGGDGRGRGGFGALPVAVLSFFGETRGSDGGQGRGVAGGRGRGAVGGRGRGVIGGRGRGSPLGFGAMHGDGATVVDVAATTVFSR